MRNATRSVMAGNPPAEAAQPSGINGMMVVVAMNEKHEPRAPRIPNFLFNILRTRVRQTATLQLQGSRLHRERQRLNTSKRAEGRDRYRAAMPLPHTRTTFDIRRRGR